MSAAEIPPAAHSIQKKRKTSTKAYIDAYETPNPHIDAGFSQRSRKSQRGSSQIEITPEFALEDFQAE